MKKYLALSVYTGIFFVITSCGKMGTTSMRNSDVIRMAEGVPANFEAATAFDDTCLSPLIDPRDGTEITFVRSTAGMADYEVPAGMYGVKKGELLRTNCKNGAVIGIVKK